ncbi:hypothetical protein [Yoonia sp. 2307UL14-13]|uniref:hypothetical protein n=1 Tax=Yoonia sp. 2307UL14-13 TaxID=3126506 RepID=UPI00309B2F4A
MLRLASTIALISSFATAAQAYGTEPTFSIIDISMTAGQHLSDPDAVCIPPAAPELLAALGLNDLMPEQPDLQVACLTE